jgi:hypothetical protein
MSEGRHPSTGRVSLSRGSDRIIKTVGIADRDKSLSAADTGATQRMERGERRVVPQGGSAEPRRRAGRARGTLLFSNRHGGAVEGRWQRRLATRMNRRYVGARGAQVLTIEPVTKPPPP